MYSAGGAAVPAISELYPEAIEHGAVSRPVLKTLIQSNKKVLGDAKLVIHNASFDMKFLNAELKWIGKPALPWEQAIDTLAIARKKFPGSPASLDALCRRFNIDNSSRTIAPILAH